MSKNLFWFYSFPGIRYWTEKNACYQANIVIGLELPGGSVVKHLLALQGMQETWVWSLGQEDPWRRNWKLTPVFLPGKSYGWRSLVGIVHGFAEFPWLSTYTYINIPEKLNLTKTRRVHHHYPGFLKSFPSWFSCAVHITNNLRAESPNDNEVFEFQLAL